jgi:adenylate kinase
MTTTAALSGTPGTGKTAIASALSGMGWHVIELGDLARSSGAVVGRDEERATDEVDMDLLEGALAGASEGPDPRRRLLVGHYAHLMPCDAVVVLRTSPGVLRRRLEDRGWPPSKVQENVEAEAVGVVLVESMERDEAVPVYEVDTSRDPPEETARLVAATLDGAGEGLEAGWVDWSEEVMGWY